MTDKGRALVLGGGGVAGIAWLNGVLAGLADAGADVTGAELLVGTSAGSAVAAQVASGLPLEQLYARQADPALQYTEIMPAGSPLAALVEVWAQLAYENQGDPAAIRRGLGARALAADTVPEAERHAVIEDRLPSHEWPERKLLVTTVNALTGELWVMDRESGVALVDAVAASCAVPMVWPPVTIEGVRYVDGGVYSATNLALAAGCERVLLISPMDEPNLDQEIAAVTEAGGRVEVIRPDEASQQAFGADPLDPSTRTPSAGAGREQGKAAGAGIAAFWN
jgi:NTE family protein